MTLEKIAKEIEAHQLKESEIHILRETLVSGSVCVEVSRMKQNRKECATFLDDRAQALVVDALMTMCDERLLELAARRAAIEEVWRGTGVFGEL